MPPTNHKKREARLNSQNLTVLCGLKNSLRRAAEAILEILFPKKRSVVEIENMSLEIFRSRAKAANSNSPAIFPLFLYQDELVKGAVWQIKYAKNKKVAKLLAELLYEEMMSVLEKEALFSDFSFPLLVTIPPSKKRLLKYGYNHLKLLSLELGNLLGNNCQIENGALLKNRQTKPQTEIKKRAERLINVRNSIEADEKLVGGRNILLLDDVITTGSTINEAMRALGAAGAKKILVFAIAH